MILSSVGYKRGEMLWNDLMREKKYVLWDVYFQSKLANILHMQGLIKRLEGDNNFSIKIKRSFE